MNTRELHFCHQIKRALDEQADNLPAAAAERLAAARKTAVIRKKPGNPLHVNVAQNAIAGSAGHFFGQPLPWLSRLGVAIPLLVGAIAFIGLYEFEQQQRIAELAELDVAVLSDELPVSTYADKGFNAYLTMRDN